MNTVRYIFFVIVLSFSGLTISLFSAQPSGRSVSDFNFDWRFFRGDNSDASRPGFDDSGWRKLNLPHDWSIEGPFSKSNYSCTGYLPGGTGWYRKNFTVPDSET